MQKIEGFFPSKKPGCRSITGIEVNVLILQTYNFNLSGLAAKRVIWILANWLFAGDFISHQDNELYFTKKTLKWIEPHNKLF